MTKATMTCLVVEDEPLAAGVLEDYIRQVPWLRFARSPSQAIPTTAYHDVEAFAATKLYVGGQAVPIGRQYQESVDG